MSPSSSAASSSSVFSLYNIHLHLQNVNVGSPHLNVCLCQRTQEIPNDCTAQQENLRTTNSRRAATVSEKKKPPLFRGRIIVTRGSTQTQQNIPRNVPGGVNAARLPTASCCVFFGDISRSSRPKAALDKRSKRRLHLATILDDCVCKGDQPGTVVLEEVEGTKG